MCGCPCARIQTHTECRCRWYNTGEGFCVTLRWKHWSTLSTHPHTHLLNQVCLRVWEGSSMPEYRNRDQKKKDEEKKTPMHICVYVCIRADLYNVCLFCPALQTTFVLPLLKTSQTFTFLFIRKMRLTEFSFLGKVRAALVTVRAAFSL